MASLNRRLNGASRRVVARRQCRLISLVNYGGQGRRSTTSGARRSRIERPAGPTQCPSWLSKVAWSKLTDSLVNFSVEVVDAAGAVPSAAAHRPILSRECAWTASVPATMAGLRRDELNVALAGLGGAEMRATEFVGGEPGTPLRLAVVECVMWADAIREELGIRSYSLTVENMPWELFGDRLDDPSERERAVQLIHGFRWARNRALHERLLKVEGVGGGFRTPLLRRWSAIRRAVALG